MVILPYATVNMAHSIAKRIKETLSGISILTRDDIGFKLTVRFGVTELDDNDTFDSLFMGAYSALYEAKENGRGG